MLSYPLSIVTAIILLFGLILLLLRNDFAFIYRSFKGIRNLGSRVLKALIKRFGYLKTFFLLYGILGSIVTIIILLNLRWHNFFESIGKVVVLWIPVLIGIGGARVRRYFRRRETIRSQPHTFHRNRKA